MNLAEYLRAQRSEVKNREDWLTELARQVTPVFKGFVLGPYRLTCGWPSKMALGRKARRVGECHSPLTSSGKFYEIFISPLLDDPLEVGGTVCHELAHVVAGVEAGHGPKYKRVCKHVGLVRGKPTSAMPGKALTDRIQSVVDSLGEYPHSAIVPMVKQAKPADSMTLRCDRCGCLIRISLGWLGKAGPPRCACGGEMEPKLD